MVKDEDTKETDEAHDKAVELLERQEAVNKKTEEILDRQDEKKAKEQVGGESDAGQVPLEKKEETNHEYHERIKKEMTEGKTDFSKDGN